ncbi:MAG: ATP-dependent Clp protease ATP-binding subunit, partial [Bacteroidaceae bacterium]|nr:ATP-dependent Clp protease ATP-binding subunit [Bacteroidaceae bacterium]
SRAVIHQALNKRCAPAFLNRIHEIINFDQLGTEAILDIVDLELEQIMKRVTELGYSIELTNEAKQFLADKGYDVQYGARPLKRALQNYIEDELSELLLNNELKQGDSIVVTANESNSDKLIFEVKR